METITTIIGILGFIGILCLPVLLARESGHEWRWMTAEESKEFWRSTNDINRSYDLRNVNNND